MIIYVQHLQICFKSGGTVEKRQVLVCHTKSGAESAFLILISDLYDPVRPLAMDKGHHHENDL